MQYDKVFCIGLNKTGTTTLASMLKYLGFAHRSWDPSALAMYRAGAVRKLLAKVDHFDSFSDWPWPLIVPELLDKFGDRARFVLTRRASSDVWIESLKGHSMITPPQNHAREMVYGYAYPQENEQAHIDFYQTHNKKTKSLFEERGLSNLLLDVCWEEGSGWKELTHFLDLPTPDVSVPHENSSKKRREFIPFFADNLSQLQNIDQRSAPEYRYGT